jgi:short-subunit dehydrogenase involved in D-alanine esterification of teichoic acids
LRHHRLRTTANIADRATSLNAVGALNRREDLVDLSNRTVLIVGGTSGIGRELARRFAAAGSTVAVGGRNPQALSELAGEGFGTFDIDVTDGVSVARARDAVLAQYPELDTVVTMSGVMLLEDLRDPAHFEAAQTTIDTNLVGTIRVIDAFTPHLVGRGAGTFVTVTSGIAFLPFPPMPTYAASKAAVHAYSEALRVQLDGTGVGVVELVPPAIAMPGQEKMASHALPLGDFATEVMRLLSQDPTPKEILVERVHMHRWAERDGTYDDLVAQRSAALAMLPGRQG